MEQWNLCKVRYEKVMENGIRKNVTEQFVVNAETFTIAELRLQKVLADELPSGFDIIAITRLKIAEIVLDKAGVASYINSEAQKIFGNNALSGEADKWFKVKINFITLDEKTGKEKKAPFFWLVNADSPRTADELTAIEMRKSMCDFTIESVVEMKIVDVLHFIKQQEV